MNFSLIIYLMVNSVLVLALAPLYMSYIKKVKAFCQGRYGPPLLQTYFNLFKLMKKEVVYSATSSAITRMAPYINIAVMMAASICVPLVYLPSTSVIGGNIILFLYLLALAKFFTALVGLDAGSTFGGMGSSREMTLSAVFEPVIIVVFAALAFVFKTVDIDKMFSIAAGSGVFNPDPLVVLISLSLFIIIIVETARVPVDNPETHLELTMIHEAMILEQSGKNLALIEMSHAIKQLLLMAIISNILFPIGLTSSLTLAALAAGVVIFVVKGFVVATAIGVFESNLAKMRLFMLPSLFMTAFFFSFLTILFEVFVK
jgi:formate hydrogenlyase subunit 4